MEPFRQQTRIRFVDTDASGRIHYTAMFRYFEAAELDFLRSRGIPHTDPSLSKIGLPRVHVECDFTGEIRFDDLIDILLTVERVGTTSFTLGFAVENSGKAAAKGRITVVCMDKATGRPTPVPEPLARVLRGEADASGNQNKD
jgi:YbgC/YbaW family acyl-CoA thioester hydrolase